MIFLFTALFIFFFMGVPIGFAMGTASLLHLLGGNLPLTVIPQRLLYSVDNFILLSIPFFILAGYIMNEGGLTQRLVRFSQLLIGRIPAGLAHANVLTSMFFAGISGAAVAEAAAIGSIMIPAMEKDGYTTDYSAALTAVASTMGPIIPPSIPMLIYGAISGASVGALFLSGAIPGILIGFSLMALNMFLLRKNFKLLGASRTQRLARREVLLIVKDGILALIMPLIIVGGVVGGIFTATESAVAAVFYSLLLGFFVFRTIHLSMIPSILLKSGVLTSIVMFIVAAAGLLAWILAAAQIPQQIANWFLSITQNPNIFILLVIILLMITGLFLDPTPALIILVPVLLPGALSFNIHIIHFGALMVIGLVIGLLTPPVGMVLFVICGIAKISLGRLFRALLPFLCAEIGILFLVGYIPVLSLWLPKFLKMI